MKFADLKNEYFERYDNEMYANDEDTQNMLDLFKKAETLSDAAKTEFVKAFYFDFALDGIICLGSKKTAATVYPNLTKEAAAAGITTTTR